MATSSFKSSPVKRHVAAVNAALWGAEIPLDCQLPRCAWLHPLPCQKWQQNEDVKYHFEKNKMTTD